MKKIVIRVGIFAVVLMVAFAFTGCQNENSNIDEKTPAEGSVKEAVVYTQKDIKEPTELDISKNGVVTLEVENLAKPDKTPPNEKSFFLVVKAKEDTDISVQYTYNTYGKEGAMFCCDLKEEDGTEIKLEPLSATYLAQSSEESYKETWLTTGIFLKSGENLFYLNGKDQTFPYCMTLKITFFEAEKIEKVILYPSEI